MNSILQNRKWQIVVLSVVVFLLYARTLNYEFIGLDEQSLLIEKGKFNAQLSNISKAFSQHVFENETYMSAPGSLRFYRPFLTVSFIVDAQFSGENFSFFHFSNIIYHLIAVIGLLFVLVQLKIPKELAFLFSLLFAAHPLLNQAVTWVPGRNDSIACGFILWSFYFFNTYLINPSGKNLFFHLLLFAGALFTKENTIIFPALCLFLLFFRRERKEQKNTNLILTLSYLAVSALWFYIRKQAVGEIQNDYSLSALYVSFLKNFPLTLQYIQKTILPVNLAVMASVQDTNYGWVIISLVLLGAGIYFTKKIPWTEISFGLLWFFLFLLPTLLFSYFEGMEHRSYLPVIGILILLAHLEPIQKLVVNKKLLTGIFGITALIFSFITFTRLPVFSNELSYWKNAYETSEHSAVVCRDYGVILTKTGDYQNAEKAYLEGIRRNPKETLLHYNLGVMYFRMNRFEDAKAQLAKELEINTTNFMIYHVLGVIYRQQNRIEEAGMMWEQAVSINPRFMESYKELFSYYAQIKDSAGFIRCKNVLEKNGYTFTDKAKEK